MMFEAILVVCMMAANHPITDVPTGAQPDEKCFEVVLPTEATEPMGCAVAAMQMAAQWLTAHEGGRLDKVGCREATGD